MAYYYCDRVRPFRAPEACQILNSPDLTRVIRTAPRAVVGGEVYVYCIEEGTDPEGWKDDNIHFQHDGTSKQPKKNPTIKKTFFQAKFSDTEFSRDFMKHVYVLHPNPNQFVLIHYLGNAFIAKEPPWPRRASKSTLVKQGHTSTGCASGTSGSVSDGAGECHSSFDTNVDEDDDCPVPPKRQKLQSKRTELKRKVEAILADFDNPTLWEDDRDLRNKGTQSSRSVSDQIEDLVTSGQFASLVDRLLCDGSWQVRRGVRSSTNPCLSLLKQVRRLWLEDVQDARARLQDLEVVCLPQFEELQQETLMALLSAVVVGAHRTDTPTLSFMATLQQWPGHLDQSEIEEVEVDVTAMYRVGDMTIAGSSLATLQGRKWLDDNVIECYLRLLREGCQLRHHCYVLPCQLAALWERKQFRQWMYEDVDLTVFTWLLMPVCVVDSHWMLLVANVRERTVGVIDSRPSDQTSKYISDWRQYMAVRSEETGQILTRWRLRQYKTLPQTDSDSCGVHVLMAAETLLKGQPPCVMRNCHARRFRCYALHRLLAHAHIQQQALNTGGTDSPQTVCMDSPHMTGPQCTSSRTSSQAAASKALTPLSVACRHLYSNNKILFAALLLLAMQGGKMKAKLWSFPRRRYDDDDDDDDDDYRYMLLTSEEDRRRWEQWDWALQMSGVEDLSRAYSYNDISQCRDILECKLLSSDLYVQCKQDLFLTLNTILEKQTEHIINTLPLQFVYQHMHVQPTTSRTLYVLIRPCHYPLLARRFAAAVAARRYARVFRHPACNEQEFVQHLAAEVKELTSDDGHMLHSSTDTDVGGPFLSWLCSSRERFLCDSFSTQDTSSLQDCTLEVKVRAALACCRSGNVRVLEQLVCDENVDIVSRQVTDKSGSTPLHEASGSEPVVRLLLDKNADVSVTDKLWGSTPLHKACESGSEAVVRLLLDKNADVSVTDKLWGSTPLHEACERGSEAVVRLLLEKNADVSVTDKSGSTPLHKACESEAVVRLLLEKNADVSVTDKLWGSTPLHEACRRGSEAVVRLLLENGADPDAVDNHGLTPDRRTWSAAVREIVSKVRRHRAVRTDAPGWCDIRSSQQTGRPETLYQQSPLMTQPGGAQLMTQLGGAQLMTQSGGAQLMTQSGGAQLMTQSGGAQLMTQPGGAQLMSGVPQLMTQPGVPQLMSGGAQLMTHPGVPQLMTQPGVPQLMSGGAQLVGQLGHIQLTNHLGGPQMIGQLEHTQLTTQSGGSHIEGPFGHTLVTQLGHTQLDSHQNSPISIPDTPWLPTNADIAPKSSSVSRQVGALQSLMSAQGEPQSLMSAKGAPQSLTLPMKVAPDCMISSSDDPSLNQNNLPALNTDPFILSRNMLSRLNNNQHFRHTPANEATTTMIATEQSIMPSSSGNQPIPQPPVSTPSQGHGLVPSNTQDCYPSVSMSSTAMSPQGTPPFYSHTNSQSFLLPNVRFRF